MTTDAATPAVLPLDLASYSTIIVAFSGGKDSLACVLHLLELGVAKDKIELWHHDVDGREGSELMDWPCTRDYCARVAEALGLRIYFSWKVGGFEREMLRDQTATAPTKFEAPAHAGDGVVVHTVGGTSGKRGTRRKFPQVAADLSVRWCSAYLKIDVGATAIRNQARFEHARTLVITGERAEESAARSRYLPFERDRADGRVTKSGAPSKSRRHVDRWRPVLHWDERRVWTIIERHRINPHPAYRLGWGRVSCAACIFGSANQWASLAKLAPRQFERVAQYEEAFGTTIQRKASVRKLAVLGNPYQWNEADAQAALARAFAEPVILEPGTWKLPAGAFGESCGPT